MLQNESLDENEEHDVPSLQISDPAAKEPATSPSWKLEAYDRRVLKAWRKLALNTQANAQNCYDWLSQHATKAKPKRCYPLKGKKHAGHWAYEIGSGDRVYYKPDEERKVVTVWYAGPHPTTIPSAPKPM